MFADLMHLPVNWVDGMKVSRVHFEDNSRYLEERLGDVMYLHAGADQFGILPAAGSLDLSIVIQSGGWIYANLYSCKAIAPNGSRIQVLPDDGVKTSIAFDELTRNYQLQVSVPQQLLVVITTDVIRRVPWGAPPAGENPPRHPFTKASVSLDIIPAGALNTSQLFNGLVVGKLWYRNGEIQQDTSFIPSCTAVNSLHSLSGWHVQYQQLLQEWESCCIAIIRRTETKTNTSPNNAGQSNSLAASIQKFCSSILLRLVNGKFFFRHTLPASSPVRMVAPLMDNIFLVHALLQCYPEKEREEMLGYFAEWTDTQAGAFEKLTQGAHAIDYDHHDVHKCLSAILDIYQHYVLVFRKLAQLDIIGKRKGQQIFVIEQEMKETRPAASGPQTGKSGTRWSPLT